MKKIVVQIVLLILLIAALHLLSSYYSHWYIDKIFPFLQQLRCGIVDFISFSWGDLVYSILVLVILRSVFIFFKHKHWKQKTTLFIAFLSMTRFVLIIAALLSLLWMPLYDQAKLSDKMSLRPSDSINFGMLVQFDSILIQRMNSLTSKIDTFSVAQINTIAEHQYHRSGISFPLQAKSSFLNNSLAYFGIEGYFNPFTGEAQINPQLPNFMLPFVVTHEMAHQIGIAAEDDANLMSYIQCVESDEKSFQYSAYFNIWLYTHRKVYKMDSLKANQLKDYLNPISLVHLDILKQRSKRYHTFLDDWSTYIFDAFLKMGNQQDGIASYRNVAYSALCWEEKQKRIRLVRK